MSTSVNTAFVTQWNDEVKQAYQQKGSKLRDAVRVVTGVTGDTYKFHKLGTAGTGTKVREAELTPVNPAHTVATATLADQYSPILLDELDMLKTNADFRREYVTASANALGRWTDSVINTALLASNTNGSTFAGGLTLAKITEALTLLNAAEVDPEDRYLIVGAKQLSDALNITALTSSDYVTMRAVMNGSIDSALGFKWIMSSLLTKDNLDPAGGAQANTRHCFAIAKSAVGLAVGQDIKTEINYVPMRDAMLVNSKISLGATVIDSAGVIEIGCVE